MARTVAIGLQDFEQIRKNDYFYVDKTDFIREWWETGDGVTLIARPRRFGKTLNMSMLEQFFSVKYADRSDLFEGLSIWENEKYRELQGTYPVIALSFARVKETSFENTKARICEIIRKIYIENDFLRQTDVLTEADQEFYGRILSFDVPEVDITSALHQMSDFLSRYYGKKVIILLDEYDTPMQEAYVGGFWDELVAFTRSMFNATFKTNPYLERAIMIGLVCMSRDVSMQDLNMKEVTLLSDKYKNAFECVGTESETSQWENDTIQNMISAHLREGSATQKIYMEDLLLGKSIRVGLEEQFSYGDLGCKDDSIWSLLLASGYLKVVSQSEDDTDSDEDVPIYELAITNREVRRMFYGMIRSWFANTSGHYNDFVEALLRGDLEEMNAYMERVLQRTLSYFDTENNEPERFYHGLVLGLIADLSREYIITSNRESGFGRYDVMLEPKDPAHDAMILEFKVHNPKKEKTLEDTVQAALAQIREKRYADNLIAHGIPEERIRTYGFAFEGKNVLIG